MIFDATDRIPFGMIKSTYSLLAKMYKLNSPEDFSLPTYDSFDDFIKSLEKNDISVYYKDLTTEDINETGKKVVKVIAPSLIDLNKSHIYPRLGAKRFFSVPNKLGLKHSEILTEMPHPFP